LQGSGFEGGAGGRRAREVGGLRTDISGQAGGERVESSRDETRRDETRRWQWWSWPTGARLEDGEVLWSNDLTFGPASGREARKASRPQAGRLPYLVPALAPALGSSANRSSTKRRVRQGPCWRMCIRYQGLREAAPELSQRRSKGRCHAVGASFWVEGEGGAWGDPSQCCWKRK